MTTEELNEKVEVEDEGSSAEVESPYRNLLFPLIVVPAMIVIVVVASFTACGAC